jgi:hypothetical protein
MELTGGRPGGWRVSSRLAALPDGAGTVRPGDGSARRLPPKPPVEVTCSWRERILAPVETVWDELTFDAVLAPLAHRRADMGLGDREARVDVRLVWGPLSCTVAGHAVFGRIQPTAHVFMLVSFPELDLDYRCAFDLAAAAADVTNLRSEGRLRCGHRRVRRCPAYLTALVENHLRAVGAATNSRAQGHYQAQVRLGGLDNRFPEPSDRSFGEARALLPSPPAQRLGSTIVSVP